MVDADVSKEVALFVVLLVEHLGVSKSQLEAEGTGIRECVLIWEVECVVEDSK